VLISAKELDPSAVAGLSEQEAARRLAAEGLNELPSEKRRGLAAIALEVLREPMILLLIGCGAIYLLLGSRREALVLLASMFGVMGISLYQSRKTERALEALRDLASPRALVIRDGRRIRIPGRDVVREDILVLSEGDRVPADAVLLWSSNLSADESLLTGESVPVRKVAIVEENATPVRPGGDDLPFVYSTTLIVRGHGIARVFSTGANTEVGKIGKALRSVVGERTRLEQETGRIVRILAAAGGVLCGVVVVVYGLTRGSWLNGLLAGLTLAMSLLPEEFPVVLTVFLAIGAFRLSREHVLTRRIPAIEMLGSATVLCVDKTGTLTLNRMSVRRLVARHEELDLGPVPKDEIPEAFHELLEYAVLASQEDPFDPMEQAIRDLGIHTLAETEHLHRNWTMVREYPLSRAMLAVSHVWRSRHEDVHVVATKGAPEAIADLCHLDAPTLEAVSRDVRRLAENGLRVLGVARSRFPAVELPAVAHDFSFEYVGLIGMADPVRPTVPAALAECREAGIRVVMITGDYPGTARNIAQQIGLVPADDVITGPELEAMDDAELTRRIQTVNIFARVVPEQKLRIVKALKARGEIVAMTGDGVNDSPALKASHIGIAMGERGTDVAREAADLVLMDDDFSSIVRAVRVGRRIFTNLQKAMAYLLAIHVPIAGMSLLPVLLGWPLVLLPVHILFLELIIDPACSLVFEAEPEDADVMKRPPRDSHERLLTRRIVGLGLLQGASVLAIVVTVFLVAYFRGQGEADARALSFTSLILANLGLILTNRSWSRTIASSYRARNGALWAVVGGALVFLAVVLYVPGARSLFRFSVLHPIDLAICIAAGLASIAWFETFKLFRSGRDRRQRD